MLQGIFDVDVNCLFFSSFILLVGLATQKDTLKTKNSSKEIQKWLHFPTSKPLSYNLLKNLDVWLNTTRCRLKMHQTKRLWKGTCWPQQKKSLRKLERLHHHQPTEFRCHQRTENLNFMHFCQAKSLQNYPRNIFSIKFGAPQQNGWKS